MASKEEKNNFSLMIETTAIKHRISHMEAILEYCEKTGLEIEVAGSMINVSLKAKLENEARVLRFIPRTGKLPV